MLRAFSGLTTRGRCLLAAGVAAAICSVILDERDLLRIAVFVIVLPLITVMVSRAAQVNIQAARKLLPERIPAATIGQVQVKLSRRGRLPAGRIMVEDGVPYLLGARPRFIVDHLPADRPVSLRYSLRPALRGVYYLGPLRAMVTDPFGLCEFERELAGRSRLLVTPMFVELSQLPMGAGLGVGEEGNTRARRGPGNPEVLVRPYRRGDDLRKVHWRTTARRDEIMVRTDESPWQGGTTVLIDRRAVAHRGAGQNSSLEWAVSFAASVCVHLNAAGHQARLVTEHGQALADSGREGGRGHDVVMLDALAVLEPTHQRDITLGQDPAQGQELVAILGALSTSAVRELIRFRPRNVRSLAVLLDVADWSSPRSFDPQSPESGAQIFKAHQESPLYESGKDGSEAPSGTADSNLARTAELLRNAGWNVTVAGRETPMVQVWATLCAASNQVPVLGEMP